MAFNTIVDSVAAGCKPDKKHYGLTRQGPEMWVIEEEGRTPHPAPLCHDSISSVLRARLLWPHRVHWSGAQEMLIPHVACLPLLGAGVSG